MATDNIDAIFDDFKKSNKESTDRSIDSIFDEFEKEIKTKPTTEESGVGRFFSRLGRSAAESATFGLAPGEIAPRKGTADIVADILGGLVGIAAPVALAGLTGGAAIAPLAGRAGLGAAARFGPLAGRVASGAVRTAGTGAAFGTMSAGAKIAQGEKPLEAIKDIPKETAIFGAFGAAGPIAGAGLRRVFKGAPKPAPKIEPPAPKQKPLLLPPGTQFTAGIRQVLKPRTFKPETGQERLTKIIEEIKPETERQAQQAARIRQIISGEGALPTESKRAMVEFLSEVLPEVPKKTWQRADITELNEIVQSISKGAESKGLTKIAERVARLRGYNLEEEFALADLPVKDRFKALANRNHWAMVVGLRPKPKLKRSGKLVEEKFVEPFKPTTTETTGKVPYSKQRVVRPEMPEWEEVMKRIKPTPENRKAVFQGVRRIAEDLAEKVQSPTTAPKAAVSTYKQPGAVREFINRTLSSVEGWLSTKGEPGRKILQMSREVERLADQQIVNWTNKMLKQVAALSKKERLNMRTVVRGKEKPINNKVRKAAEVVKAYYNERPDRIRKAGLTLRTVDGENIPFKEAKNHFPLRLDWKKIEDKTGQIRPDVLQKLVKTGQAKDIQEAERLLRLLRRAKFERHATFQHEAKKIELPEYELDPLLALQSDLAEGETRIAQALKYGPKDERLIEAVESMAPVDRAYALKVADRLRGIDARADIEKHLIEGLLSYNVISKLGLAAIPNATQNVNTALRLGVASLIKGIKSAFANRKEAEQFAKMAGIYLDPANMARTIAETRGGPSLFATKFMQATGFNTTEYWNRLVSLQAAKGWAEDMFKALKKPGSVSWVQRVAGKQPERIKRLFREAGIDIDKALRRGSLTEEELAKVARWNVLRTQFPASQLDVPLWASSPWGRVLFQFKRYAFNQGRLLKRELLDEAVRFFKTGGRDGSLRAWGPFLTLFPSAGWLVGLIRDWISGKEAPAEKIGRTKEAISERDIRQLVMDYLDAYTWVGGLGIVSDTAQQLAWDEQEAIMNLLGPTSGLAESAFGVAKQGITGLERAVKGEEVKPRQLTAAALRSAVRGNVPIAGYPMARGELPFGVKSRTLESIFQPRKKKKLELPKLESKLPKLPKAP